LTRRLSVAEATELATRACRAAGASEAAAQSLARASVAAELQGRASAGFSHLLDYLAALREGRIDGAAEPVLTSPAPAIIACDARGGIAQLGFDRALADLCSRATACGLALFAGRSGYTAGELGHYVRRPAEAGLVALATANGPALMAPPDAKRAVYCTNPIAFAAPLDEGPPLLIDQATSATAFVTLRQLAEKGETLPSGWAIDETGRETTDPRAAMRGALVTFGGPRGANIALMVEVLAAGLANANWSLDAPPFERGNRSPGAGLLVIAIDPRLLAPDFSRRLGTQLKRLEQLGVYVPGRRGAADHIELTDSLHRTIESACA